MAPIAAQAIDHWNERLGERGSVGKRKGLIAVSFDQRNHGTRLVDQRANEDWRRKNDRHAMDMFSIYGESPAFTGSVAPTRSHAQIQLTNSEQREPPTTPPC
jgi:hypothetical protein